MPDAPDSQTPQFIPPQPTAQPVPPYQVPPYQPVVAPPPKQGSSVLKIVLIITAVFAGIAAIGAGIVGYGVYRLAKAVKMNTSQPVTASDLGVAIYPGAVQGKGGMRMTLAGKAMTTANFLTPDSKDQVMAFYQSNLGPAAQSTTNANGESLVLIKGPGESVAVTVLQNAHNGKTQFVIVHTANASSSNSPTNSTTTSTNP
jgi:hypothetical protein